MPHILLQNKITKAFENGNIVCGVYLDLKKAFDTVDPVILISKLEKYGIVGMSLQIIKSYLTNRTQCVEIEGNRSEYRDVDIGVPQGSILGPLLFLIYINDFPKICTNSSCILYADDTAIFFENENAETLQHDINLDLPRVSEWLKSNKLSLNTDKTFYQIYNMSREEVNIDILLSGKYITLTDKIKYLGMFIDNKLSWNEHINYVATVVSSGIGMLYRSKYFLTKASLLLLYNSLILPHLNYCAVIWAHTFPTYISKLDVLQKRAVRIVTNAHRLAHTDPIFKNLKLLRITELAKQQMILIIQRVVKGNIHPAMKTLFQIIELPERITRLRQHIAEPFTDKLYRTRTISWTGPRIWNKIVTPIYPLIDDIPSSKYLMKKITKDYFLCVNLTP